MAPHELSSLGEACARLFFFGGCEQCLTGYEQQLQSLETTASPANFSAALGKIPETKHPVIMFGW